MIEHEKFRPHSGNLVSVHDVPGEYYVHVCEPGYRKDFNVAPSRQTFERICSAIEEIMRRHGGRVSSRLFHYGSLYVGDATKEAMLEICEIAEVSAIGPNVSMLPPDSHRYYTGHGEKPENFQEDVLAAAAHLARHELL